MPTSFFVGVEIIVDFFALASSFDTLVKTLLDVAIVVGVLGIDCNCCWLRPELVDADLVGSSMLTWSFCAA